MAKYNSVRPCALPSQAREYYIPNLGVVGSNSCPTGSIVNTDTRTADLSGRNPPLWRSLHVKTRTIRLGLVRCTCRARTRFPVAPSAAPCSRLLQSRQPSAQSADSSCIRASSAGISIPLAGLNVCSRFWNALPRRMLGMTASSTPSVSVWRNKPQRDLPLEPAVLRRMTCAAPSTISSKINQGF
jgi:hypothetical protein